MKIEPQHIFHSDVITEISGIFVKIAYADTVDIHLEQGHAIRPAARFNRAGQDALYLSPDEASARVAIGEYVRESDRPRVLVQYEVEPCHLVDFRHPKAASVYDLAKQPWQPPFMRGEEPPSWHAADHLRTSSHVGLIDPSRQSPGLWHITLLKWNMPGAPRVRVLGSPTPINIKPQ